MALRSYLVGEVAEDFSDGLLSRREALRRLGLLGVGMAAAASVLAACAGGGDDEGAASTSTTSTADPTDTTADQPQPEARAGAGAETITFAGASGDLTAYWADAAAPGKGAVLIVHENRGLTPHFGDLAGRFAADGYSALAVDLLSPEGGTADLADPAAAPTALGAAPLDRLLGDLRSGIDELQRRSPDRKVGAIGFCFGGGMVWNLLAAGERRLAAAAPFYGPAPSGATFDGTDAAVLAVYAERDTRVNASRDAAATALAAADLTHEVKTYPGVDHAFFNDTGARYDPAAARQAYADVLAWFERHLAA